MSIELARKAAMKARCLRRSIGCVITMKDGTVIAEGYNGTPDGMPPCLEKPCPDAYTPAGQGSGATRCYGIHAEVRAVMAAGNDLKWAHTLYSTKAPCRQCVLSMLNTPIQRIVFETASNETENRELWEAAGREWVQEC